MFSSPDTIETGILFIKKWEFRKLGPRRGPRIRLRIQESISRLLRRDFAEALSLLIVVGEGEHAKFFLTIFLFTKSLHFLMCSHNIGLGHLNDPSVNFSAHANGGYLYVPPKRIS